MKIYHCQINRAVCILQKLEELILSCLKKTEEFDVTSIAFAALGTGLLRYPAEIVGECFINAVKQYCEKSPKTKLTSVYALAYHKDEQTKKVNIGPVMTKGLSLLYLSSFASFYLLDFNGYQIFR